MAEQTNCKKYKLNILGKCFYPELKKLRKDGNKGECNGCQYIYLQYKEKKDWSKNQER